MEQQTAVTTTTALTSLQHSKQEDSVNSGLPAGASIASVSSIASALASASGVGVTLAESTTKPATSVPARSPSVGSGSNRIFSRNSNGTMVTTSMPSNEAELQLFRVLQRASLLVYFDTLLEMGGDDVQQLCDAGEEEFLEIMALVNMASKPLHVRRLQKALHEWTTNPSHFQTPLTSLDMSRASYSPEPSVLPYRQNPHFLSTTSAPITDAHNYTPSPTSSTTPSTSSLSSLTTTLQQATTNSMALTPSLTEHQVFRITAAAERLSRTLPQLEPKPQSTKRKGTRNLELIIAMNESDPRRMEEIRKYSAIYGRFDCKRKPEKPLTLHEVCVNEAAAQICKFIPALLTRRDELFPLARQVVRDAGFGHSASIRLSALSQQQSRSMEESDTGQSKRSRLSSDTSSDFGKEYASEDIKESHYQRMDRPFDLSDISKFGYSRSDFDDNESRYSFSNSSSSPIQHGTSIDQESIENDIMSSIKEEYTPSNDHDSNSLGVQVISSSGGHIIAVTNPALALSPALVIKREVISPKIP